MRERRLIGAALATLALAPAAAEAQDGPRQQMTYTLTEMAPGAPSAARLDIDYVNPSDPAAKPYAVQTLVESLAPGARFDTSVPERCAASDAALTSQGAAACPAGSVVGGGRLDLDSGFAGPARIVRNRVTLLNNTNELIFLVEPEQGGRSVTRSRMEGGTIFAGAPPLPGGPPDGFTAIKTVRVELRRIVAGGRGYITTPPICPVDGAWVNSIEFTYRDGVKQTAATRSPCVTSAATADTTPPRIRARGLGRRCAGRGIRARIAIADVGSVGSTTAYVDGRRVRTTRAARFTIRVRPRSRIKVVARDRSGNRAMRRFLFRRC